MFRDNLNKKARSILKKKGLNSTIFTNKNSISVKDDINAHANWVFKHIYSVPYPGDEKSEIARFHHGIQHVARAAFYVPVFARLYSKYGDQDAASLSEEDIKLLQIAALFHDSAREGEGIDKWDHESALLLYYYFRKVLGVGAEKAKLIAEATANKDSESVSSYFEITEKDGEIHWEQRKTNKNKNIYQKIIHDVDCLDIIRVRENFDDRYLDFNKDIAVNNKDAKQELQLLISEAKSLIEIQGDSYTRKNASIKKRFEQINSYDLIRQSVEENQFKLLGNIQTDQRQSDVLTPLSEEQAADFKEKVKIFENDMPVSIKVVTLEKEEKLYYFTFTEKEAAENYLEKIKSYANDGTAYPEVIGQQGQPYYFYLNSKQYNFLQDSYNKWKILPVSSDFLIKSIHGNGSRNFFHTFKLGITRTSAQKRNFILRWGSKKRYTVKGDGIQDRYNRTPQIAKNAKSEYSQPQSVGFVTDQHTPPPYRSDADKTSQQIAFIFDIKDSVANRLLFYTYENRTLIRPYDFDTEDTAKKYYDKNALSDDPILFSNIEFFKKNLLKPENKNRTVEVLARLRWNTDGTSKIAISKNTIESRWLAQGYADNLARRLTEQCKERGDINSEILAHQVPICFYFPASNLHMKPYNIFDQKADIALAYNVFNDENKRNQYYSSNNYEFLLVLEPIDIQAALMEIMPNGFPLIFSMIESGYSYMVKMLLDKAGPEFLKNLINFQIEGQYFNDLLLVYAAQVDDLELMQALVDSESVKSGVRYPANSSPLHYTVLNNNKEIAKLLSISDIEQALKMNSSILRLKNGSSASPIAFATENGQWHLCSIIIEKLGLNHFLLPVCSNALDLISEKRKIDFLRFSISQGYFSTAEFLIEQSICSKEKINEILKDYCAPKKIQGGDKSLLYISFEKNFKTLTKALLQNSDCLEETTYAINHNDNNVASQILKLKLSKMSLDNKLEIFKLAVKSNNKEICQTLLAHGIEKDCLAQGKETALIIAVKYNQIEIVKFLLENYDAKINKTDSEGNTALFYASNNGLHTMAALLMSKGADASNISDNKQALEKSSTCKVEEITDLSAFIANLNFLHAEHKKQGLNSSKISRDFRSTILDEVIFKIENTSEDMRKQYLEVAKAHPMFSTHRNPFHGKFLKQFQGVFFGTDYTSSQIRLQDELEKYR